MKYPLTPVLILLLVASCSSLPPYAEPDAALSAKVRIRNLQVESYYMHIMLVDPEKCSASAFVGIVTGGREPDARRVGMLGSEEIKQGILERQVETGKPISFVPHVFAKLDAFTVLTSMGVSQDTVRDAQTAACATPVFVPKAGEQYEILYNPLPGNCRVTLVRLSSAVDGTVTREDITGTATGTVASAHRTYSAAQRELKCSKS